MTITFNDAYFEDGVAILMASPWKGVNSMSFNGSASLQGVLEWIEGFQFKIDINGDVITLGARRNYGNPISCEQFFPSIDNDCADIISFINSVTVNKSPGRFEFVSGPNIVIFEEPSQHRVYIGLNFDPTDICSPPTVNPIPH